MRLTAATLLALAVIAAVVVLGATQWPDAIDEDGIHGWLPWVDDGMPVAWLVAVAGFGTALARGVERPAARALRYLGVASLASLAVVVGAFAGMARDDQQELGCGPTDANAVGNCHFWSWFGDVVVGAGALLVSLVAFAVVGMTAASTQKVWEQRREYRRRYG
jgi:hypothetical protein